MKIGAIIQARFGSSRLPGKVLMPLPFQSGKPLLKHITDRIKTSRCINYIGIASSEREENQAIEQFATQEQVDCFRGSEENVLSRFIAIIKKEKLDYVVRLTGDNPLVVMNEIDQAIEYHIQNQFEYTKSSGLPLGLNFEIITAASLLALENNKLEKEDYEHVTIYFSKANHVNKGLIQFEFSNLLNVRCTVDYPSDFAMMNILMQSIDLQNRDILSELSRISVHSPWIFAINRGNFQKKQYKNLNEEFEDLKFILKENEFNYTLDFLSKKFNSTVTDK